MRKLKIIYLLLTLIFCSCGWKDAKVVIATAERMDKTEHVIYDDTAAIAGVIRKLDNPIGRLIHKNTLGKAYYYMGRNLEDNYQQVAEAAKCYIEADRLQIDDPIYRGRVNSCMGYICAQNNSDSLALIFYNQASKVFKESDKDWYYAHSILNIASCNIYLHLFTKADSLLQLANTYPLDTAYCARLYEIQGLYFYEQQQYDSALVYFNRGLDYWRSEEEKCFTKYYTLSEESPTGYKTTLELSDDAAHVNWGGAWRMPTHDELTELIEGCSWTWTTQNGVNGCKVTSNINGNSIFLPAAGYRHEESLKGAALYGHYWSSTPYVENHTMAYLLYINESCHSTNWEACALGYSVRPVVE